MLRGLYDAGSALQAATINQEVTAENLAHATTPGYRRQGVTFQALLAAGLRPDPTSSAPAAGAGASHTASYTLFTPGPVQQTGNPLDLALSGDAFFALESPQGPVYTRNGSFQISARGELVSGSGLRVLGQGGPITLPQNAGEIHVGADGAVVANGAEVGRLQIAQFDDNQALRRVGTTLFDGPTPRQPAPGSVRVEQGFREGSNVQMVQEMVSMIAGMRQYEAAERALKALGDVIGQNTRPQG